ncbi:MAG: AAA family ATPase [Nocardioidaceae bacterium]
MTDRVPVLVAAGGAAWEAPLLELLGRSRTVVLHRRCVDLPDLLANAATGLAGAAVVAADLPGVDADSVHLLAAAGVGVLLVVPEGVDPERYARLGARQVVTAAALDPGLLDRLVEELARSAPPDETPADPGVRPPGHAPGRLTVVWGPAGAPGRTTVAVALAAETAARGHDVLLVDADPYAGAVAQHLGVLDEISGLLAAARLANAGDLDRAALAATAREAAPCLRVLTGLPRADRWSEVRPAAWEEVLDAAVSLSAHVVVDSGFSLEDGGDPYAGGPPRNGTTLGALDRADEVVTVGSADPVGLARLARGLVDLRDRLPGTPLRVVVNRMRPSLGWSEREVTGMVEGFAGPVPVHFLPEDRAAADRALMAGRSLVETGESALRAAVGGVADAMLGERTPPRRRGLRRRTAGRDR